MGYSRSIRGVFTGYSYVSVMCRLCIGYVSVMYRNRHGGGRGDSTTLLTTIVFNKSLSAQCVVLGAMLLKKVVCVVD